MRIVSGGVALAVCLSVACAPAPETSSGDGGSDLAGADLAGVDLAQSQGNPDLASNGPCLQATLLWEDDFETNDYRRWSSHTYDDDWDNGYCHSNGFSTDHAVSGTHSHRSEVTCAAHGDVHRGYGGVQFSGDMPVDAYTNVGSGIDAPHGVVNTFYSWLEAPGGFGGGTWFSPWTSEAACDWSQDVVTLGLEDPGHRITPAHVVNTGGTVTFAPNAPGMPFGQWVRTTVYLNYHAGEMRVWQDGTLIVTASFTRPTKQICQWHWGLYASGDNTNIVLYEDDNRIWKLGEDLPANAPEPQAFCP